jgi:hypothetical protein
MGTHVQAESVKAVALLLAELKAFGQVGATVAAEMQQ